MYVIKALLLMFAVSFCLVPGSSSGPNQKKHAIAFLCADNGTFSGLGELDFVSQTVHSQVKLDVPSCVSAFIGYATTAKNTSVTIVIATTGIGAVNAALCTAELLQNPDVTFTQMVFVGTSGMSPVVGGFDPIVPGGCSEMNTPTTVAVGSVCVASAALDMSCGMCISNPIGGENNLPNECSRPNCKNHTSESLFGPCSQSSPAQLANVITEVNRGFAFPVQPEVVASGTTLWWGAHQAVDAATRMNPPRTPTIFGNCVEADAHQIWVGSPLDYLCREYTAELLGAPHSSENVVCTVAMESTGFLAAVKRSSSGGALPEVAIVRAAANWDMYPLANAGGSAANTTTLRWAQNTSYVNENVHLAFVKASYRYAVQTSNDVVLNYIAQL